METEWIKFKNGIYNRTSDGKGKAMIKELNLLEDVLLLEVYFYDNHMIEISLREDEVNDVVKFEDYLRKNCIMVYPKPKVPTFHNFLQNLISTHIKDYVFIDNQNFDVQIQRIINSYGIKSKGGFIFPKDNLRLFRINVDGFGVVDEVEYKNVTNENILQIL